MSHAVDFAKLKERVSITQVLELLGIKHLTEHGEQVRGTCPLCQSTNPRGFVVTPAKGTWYCFSERKGGDLIRLAALHWRTDDRTAAVRIADSFGGAGKADDNAHPQQEAVADARQPSGFDPRAYLETLDPQHDALKGIGVSVETLRLYRAGYCSKGLNRGRLAIAWCKADGNIRAFIGVGLNGEQPQYQIPKGMQLPHWFGTDRIRQGDELRIVPSVLDVLHAADNGCTSVICPVAPTGPEAIGELKVLMEEQRCTVTW